MKFKKVAAILLTATIFGTMAAGCGKTTIDQTAVAATLDDKEISMGVANFMAQYQAVQYDAYLLSYYGEDMWTNDDSGSGTTMTDTVKDSVMENLEEMYLLDAHAADYGVELTDDEQSAITAAAEKFMSDNSSSAAQAMGASQENVEEMLRLNTVQKKMQEAIEDDIDTKVTKEEMAQKTLSYVKIDIEDTEDTTADEDAGADSDTEADDSSANDEKNEKAAKKLLNSIKKASQLEDKAKQSGYEVDTVSFGTSDLDEDENSTALPIAVLKAADKLKDGELASKAIAGDDGAYYVVRMDNTDDKDAAETKKESILSERRSERYDEVVDGYKEDCKWEVNDSEWKKVNFDELYTVASSETDTAADDTEETGTAADDTADTSADDATEDSTVGE